MMASLPVTLAALLLAQVASCQPAVSFPFNSQLPLAARINTFFSISFSSSTFTSSFSSIRYSLGRHPDWLSIESHGRRLYGTPTDAVIPPGDVVGQEVDIIATDNSGSTTMTATLVVSRKPPPAVHLPLTKQIDRFGNFSAPSSILLYPSTGFTYSFDPNTFGDPGLNHYATSGDSSPLPAWIKFDADSMTFSGTTPPFESLVQPPQSFDFRLVASDIIGFSAASLSFAIVVGIHQLTTDKPIVTLNASWGSELTYAGLERGIQLDGKPVAPGYLRATTTGLPAWLSYDAQTSKLHGTPGQGDHSTNFTISFRDTLADRLDVLVVVNVASSLFESTLGDIEARPGGDFNVNLGKYLRSPADIDVEVTTKPSQDWLKVDGLRLSGHVPGSAKGGFQISIRAASKRSKLEEMEVSNVSFLAVDGTTTTTTMSESSETTMVTPTPTQAHTRTNAQTQTPSAAADAAETPSGHLSTVAILLATIMPIIFIAAFLMLLVCFFRRRRTRQTYLSSKYRAKISNPVAGSFRTNESDPSMPEVERIGSALPPDMRAFRPAMVGYTEVTSQSSRQRSSETLGGTSDREMPQPLVAEKARAPTIRSVGNSGSNSGRQSWVTVEGEDTAVAARSEDLPRSRNSDTSNADTTLSEATHQLLPTPLFPSDTRNGDFRSGLEMAMPTIADLSSVQPTPTFAYKPPQYSQSRQSLGERSMMTCSSAVLPSMCEGGQRANGRAESNWETIAESETGESISELRRPDKALLSSRPGDSKQLHDVDSSNGSKSLGTETSFGSSENWRVIGPRNGLNGPSASHRDLASRPSTARDGAWQDEGAVPDPLSLGRRGDDVRSNTTRTRPGPSLSNVCTQSDDEEGGGVEMSGGRGPATWNRDQSGQHMSEGSGSFTVFL